MVKAKIRIRFRSEEMGPEGLFLPFISVTGKRTILYIPRVHMLTKNVVLMPLTCSLGEWHD